MGADPPSMETDRLILRQWRASDRDPFARLNADADVMEHFPSTLTVAESDAFVDRATAGLAERRYGLWATEIRSTGEFIGFIGLNAPSWETSFTPCIEVGWRLARSAWGSGYAPEGATAVLAFAFGHVDLPDDEVVSFTTVENLKSRRVMEKIGMTHDASRDFDHPNLPDWPHRRHVLYAIDRDAWQRRNPWGN